MLKNFIYSIVYFQLIAVCLADTNENDLLSTEVQVQLKKHYNDVYSLVKQYVDAIKSADINKSQTVLQSISGEVLYVSKHNTNSEDLFKFGLTVGGVTAKYTEGDNKLTAKILENIISGFHTKINGFDEGLRLVLLQKYYHLGRWTDGEKMVASEMTNRIVSGLFVREVAGFSSAMVTKGGMPKQGCALYASILDSNTIPESPSFSYGESLLNLSHIYASAGNYSQQLEVLKSIKYKDANYFKTNEANISYFSYMALTSLNDRENAMLYLSESAKSAKNHPGWVDNAIQDALTNAIDRYQKAGFIDGSLKLKFDPKPKDGTNKGFKKNVRILVLAFFVLSPLIIMRFAFRRN